MTFEPVQIANSASWAVTGLGLALWLWSWVGVRDPIAKQRFSDCAAVLTFASILVRVVTQTRAMSMFDWAMVFLGPLFIAAALWRLAQTGRLKS
ncbi:MAG: hypothetical protein ACK4FG_06720 [Brevundimonas sp.]|jgi:hypothetical protein